MHVAAVVGLVLLSLTRVALCCLQAVATKPQPAKPQQEAVREVLALLGRKAGGPELRQLADAAWQLLLDLGVVQLHAPLQLLRAGVDLEFPAHVEREAQVSCGVAGSLGACVGCVHAWLFSRTRAALVHTGQVSPGTGQVTSACAVAKHTCPVHGRV
jgi:hypothetical protein